MFKFAHKQKSGFSQHFFSHFKNAKKSAGFTLVEIIVAVGIFSLVVVVAMGAVLAIVGANKKAQALHNIINNLNLAVESMVRDMRTGFDYECANWGAASCDLEDKFSFISEQYGSASVEITYEFESGVDGDGVAYGYLTKSVNGGAPERVTSEEVVLERVMFTSVGMDSGDYLQPLVRVFVQGYAKVGNERSEFNLQTLVSQRRLDIENEIF